MGEPASLPPYSPRLFSSEPPRADGTQATGNVQTPAQKTAGLLSLLDSMPLAGRDRHTPVISMEQITRDEFVPEALIVDYGGSAMYQIFRQFAEENHLTRPERDLLANMVLENLRARQADELGVGPLATDGTSFDEETHKMLERIAEMILQALLALVGAGNPDSPVPPDSSIPAGEHLSALQSFLASQGSPFIADVVMQQITELSRQDPRWSDSPAHQAEITDEIAKEVLDNLRTQQASASQAQ